MEKQSEKSKLKKRRNKAYASIVNCGKDKNLSKQWLDEYIEVSEELKKL